MELISRMSYYDEALFSNLSDPKEQKRIFKKYVKLFILELSSYCNRKCGYCPVAYSDRNKTKYYIDEGIFSKIISDLAKIDYEERVCLNLYNEPMAAFPMLIESIRSIRKALPKAHIFFHTNGDYLDHEKLKLLIEAGLSSLEVSMHMPNNKPYEDKYMVNRFIEFAVRCQKKINTQVMREGEMLRGVMKFDGCLINVNAVNYYEHGVDRAGSVDSVPPNLSRTEACIRPFSNFTVSYDGSIYPCCMFFTDDVKIQKHVVANISGDQTIFDIYASKKMSQWRLELFSESPKISPCDTCSERNWPLDKEEIQKRDYFLKTQLGRDE